MTEDPSDPALREEAAAEAGLRACQTAVREADEAVRRLTEQRDEQDRRDRERADEECVAAARARDADGLGYDHDLDDESEHSR